MIEMVYHDDILTTSRIRYLKSIGVPDEDIDEIRDALKYTNYDYLNYRTGENYPIDVDEAIKKLGVRTFLSGISRSAFHWNCTRETPDGKGRVYFDSSKRFKRR